MSGYVAVTVTLEFGTVFGAVYLPVLSIVPHAAPPAVQETLQVTLLLLKLPRRVLENENGGAPVGTLAVAGVTESVTGIRRMPPRLAEPSEVVIEDVVPVVGMAMVETVPLPLATNAKELSDAIARP